jgi:hypothetical protein
MDAGHRATRLLHYVYRKAFHIFGAFSLGAPSGHAALDAQTLTLGQTFTSKATQVRHVIFALDPKVPEAEAITRLMGLCRDWVTVYAPGREWVAGLHRDSGQVHGHLVIQNVRDGKALRLMPHMVAAMARMEFTTWARNAKGVGAPGLGHYSKPRKPLIADTIRTATKEQLSEWIAAGKIRPSRRDSHGVITSVEWDSGNGKKPTRIRLSTLQRLALRAAVAPAGTGDDAGRGARHDTGLARPRRDGSGRQFAGDRGRRRERGDVGLLVKPASSFDPRRRRAGVGLQRDQVPDRRMATQGRRRPAARTGRPVAAAIRGLGHVISRNLNVDRLIKFSVTPITIKTKGH